MTMLTCCQLCLGGSNFLQETVQLANMMSLLYLRFAARAWRHEINWTIYDAPQIFCTTYVYVDTRNQRRETLVSAIFPTKPTCMLLATNEANNPKVRVFFWNAVDVLIKANYTKHLCIDLSSTHMLLNTGIVPYKRANHSPTRRTPWCWCHESPLLNDDVTKIFDVILSVAKHYGKTFIPPLAQGRMLTHSLTIHDQWSVNTRWQSGIREERAKIGP